MNIREARKQIKSVGNVRKITKAMQMVSAIKMRKAQQAALDGRPYQEHLEIIINKIAGKIDTNLSVLLSPKIAEGSSKKDLAIVIASNKGLCGGFNMNLLRFIIKNVNFDKTDFVILGKKAELLGKFGAKIIANYSSAIPITNVSALFNLALDKYLNGSYTSITLFYNKFISTLRVEPLKSVLLPLSLEMESNLNKESIKQKDSEYIIEPDPAQIIDPLLKSFVEEKIRNAIIQNEAGEHSSRMIAMKNATENANDVIYNLTMLRNKLRQEKITNELLDMVTAKESVEQN
ncbi:MAG: ATP synthase F1 subunit gamma [bacterium]|nr:ATP synthase F1 subunit gamma [bacterium]